MSLTSRIRNRLHQKRVIKAAEKARASHRRTEYLLDENSPFSLTEAFRNLKAAISVSVPRRNGGVAIMLTSGYPEDGKTTVAVNLALSFALSDAKVIVVDADIRKGRVAKYFKQKPVPGLSDYLSGHSSLEEVIHASPENENLSYITCGTHSPKPYELLESEEMRKLVAALKERYDYIVFDTPPVLLVSDALALAPVVDGAALVCRHQVSFVSDISRSINTLSFAKANVLGVIVNDYKALKSANYYDRSGYKKYYYRTTYSYSNTEEDKE